VLQALEGKAFGQELWRPLALGALLLAVCEVLLARWIALRRRTGLDEKVSFEERAAPSASFREQLSRVTSWKPNSAERT
jgi:hypothetical protein